MSSYPSIQLLIDGHWRDGAGWLPVTNPATGAPVGQVPVASPEDVADAVAAAERGLLTWRATPAPQRSRVLCKAAQLLRERVESVALATVLEMGKPLAAARLEVLRAASILEWDAGQAQRQYARTIEVDQRLRCQVLREPIGVVAAFSPWNAPVGSPMRKIAAALAAGCSLVLKPAEETPAGAANIARALLDAGLPPGVLNLLYGEPAMVSQALVRHPAVRLVSFTGSVPVGRQLAAAAGTQLKPVLLELGGHAPVVVCDDVDPIGVARQAVRAKANNAGQICVSPTRFLVQERVFDAFTDAFVEAARAVRTGDGLQQDVQMGPLANERRVREVADLVDDARRHGARVLCGGTRPAGPGFFYPLTVLADVPAAARILREEPFGPVAILNRFSTLDEALAQANALPLGLAAYAFTRDAARMERLTEGLQVGSMALNTFTVSAAETPFGGVKDSGWGREGGEETLQAYTIVKSVMQAVPEVSHDL
jgi:succinate-semialdehyde dehydrogenase / glutarate-semialdehyde dehydrogenase